MPILRVRNVPDRLYEQIKQQAQSSNRSISAQVITLLHRALTDGGPPQSECLKASAAGSSDKYPYLAGPMNPAFAVMLPSIWINYYAQDNQEHEKKTGTRRAHKLCTWVMIHKILMFVGYNKH
ncbi:hypothetical protein ACFLUA_04325 [Chloroflexota bacterium]